MVDGSNESLYHADEEMHPLLQNFSPLQTIPKNLDVEDDSGDMQVFQLFLSFRVNPQQMFALSFLTNLQ